MLLGGHYFTHPSAFRPPPSTLEVAMVERDSLTIVACIGLTLTGLLLSVLLGAVVLRAAAKRTSNIDLPFWPSMGTVMVYSLANFGLGLIAALLASMAESGAQQTLLKGAVVPVGLLFQSAIISGRHHVTLGKGIKISILMWLVILLIGAVVAASTIGLRSALPRV
jgi:hypothetical protein